MFKFPDISEYYNLEKATLEEKEWAKTKFYIPNGQSVQAVIKAFDIHSILEVGCGGGWLATQIPISVEYHAIDKNLHFLEWAKEKNPGRTFEFADIREYVPSKKYDLVVNFAFLKHFSLDEVPLVLSKLLSFGRFCLFEIQITKNAFDNGTEYHHSFVQNDDVKDWLLEASHEEISRICTYKDDLFEVYSILTRKKYE